MMNNLCRRWFDPRSRTAARNEVSNIFHHHHHHHLNFTSQSCLSHNHDHIATCLKMFHSFSILESFKITLNLARACMDENGMRFDEESVEELTRALYQVENVRYRVDHDED